MLTITNKYISKTNNQIFNINLQNQFVKNQGKSNLCSIYTLSYSIEYLLRKNKQYVVLSIYNLYLKSYLCANKLNPNNPNNYKIMNPSCGLINYGQDQGFSLKNTIYGGIYGICYEDKWKNIPPYVPHLLNFTFAFKNLNALLKEDYIYSNENHVHIKKFIKIVPKIENKNIEFNVKEIVLPELLLDQNDLFMSYELYRIKYDLFVDDCILDNYNYTKQNKQVLINTIKNILTSEKLPILVSFILPTNVENNLDDTYSIIEYEKNNYEDYHACLIVGYTNKQFKILTSWGSDFGIDGCFYVNNDYLFKKSDSKQLNLDLNQIYVITDAKIDNIVT